MAQAVPLTVGPPDPGPAAKAFGGGLGILPHPMFFGGSANVPTAPNADPQAPPAPAPAQIAVTSAPPSVMERLGGLPGLAGAVGSHLIGPVAGGLLAKAGPNFEQGNVGEGVGNVIGGTLGGAAHAIVTPVADTALAAGALGMGVAHFAHNVYNGLMGGPAQAAPLPAQAVAPVAPAVGQLPPISSELAALKAAQFEATPPIPGRYGDWTPGSTALHGVVPSAGGAGILIPGAAPAAGAPVGFDEAVAMRAPAPAQGGLPGVQTAAAAAPAVSEDGPHMRAHLAAASALGLPEAIARVTPPAQLRAATNDYFNRIKTGDDAEAQRKLYGIYAGQYAAATKPVQNETVEQRNARILIANDNLAKSLGNYLKPTYGLPNVVNAQTPVP